MADREFANQPASNNRVRFRDVSLVEEVEGPFAQLMELFAAWRADIDSVPFEYSDDDLMRAWEAPETASPADPQPPDPPQPAEPPFAPEWPE